jgi:hypothetical protein
MAKKETNTKLEVAICDLKDINSIKIESLIREIRGWQVILDSDLAMLYGVETRTLNQAVKRNIKRFPEDFMFQLTKDEANHSRSQIVILNNDELSPRSQFATLNTQRGQNIKYLPYAFTRNGIAMLSSVLRSDTAVEVNIRIMRAFTMIPQLVNHNTQIIQRIFNIEQHQIETDEKIDVILERIEGISPKLLPEQVFHTGCVWDAWTYISDLVRSARQRIALIDNYVDDRVLSMFTKRADGVSATIHTRYNEQFLTDLKKHNTQYPEIEFIQLPHRNHDRFLIIDDKVYLLGASLKDMGTGLCAVTEMSIAPETILELLK